MHESILKRRFSKGFFLYMLWNISANSDVWFAWLKKGGDRPIYRGSPVPLRQGKRNRLADTGPQAVAIVAGSLHHPVDARQLARTLVSKSQPLQSKLQALTLRRLSVSQRFALLSFLCVLAITVLVCVACGAVRHGPGRCRAAPRVRPVRAGRALHGVRCRRSGAVVGRRLPHRPPFR